MTELMWARSHVRQLLQDEWKVPRVHVDPDGDVAFRSGTAMCWVTVLDSDPIMVRVFSHAVFDVRPTAKLLRELSDIQNRVLSARVGYDHGIVCVTQTIAATGLTGPVLAQAVDSVGDLSAEIGPLLAPMFAGSTPFDLDEPVQADSDDGSG